MIDADHLTKRYKDKTVVRDVSFHCAPGTVTGFLGPNGAGKSSTMRMICGLSRPNSGHATVSGVAYGKLPNPGRHVGVLLDTSAQHAGRSGRETLLLAARVLGLPTTRVDAVLETVGLGGDAATKRVGQYSLGMRQRLGIGQALLGDPSILVLDEPANGLDPVGIRWMRELLQAFADRGGTVLLSSHLLNEVQAVADFLVVINEGRIVANGRADDLLRTSGTLVRTADAADTPILVAALVAAGLEAKAAGNGDVSTSGEPAQVGRLAAPAGIALQLLQPADGGGLEQLYLDLTGADAPAAGAPTAGAPVPGTTTPTAPAASTPEMELSR